MKTLAICFSALLATSITANAQSMNNDTKRTNEAPVGSASSPSKSPSAPVGTSGAQGAGAAAPNAGATTGTGSMSKDGMKNGTMSKDGMKKDGMSK